MYLGTIDSALHLYFLVDECRRGLIERSWRGYVINGRTIKCMSLVLAALHEDASLSASVLINKVLTRNSHPLSGYLYQLKNIVAVPNSI
jgi:hypothetical protein